MTDNTSSSLPIKLLWQGALIVGLILGVWVLGRTLPLDDYFPALKEAVPDNRKVVTPTESSSVKIKACALPRMNPNDPSALRAIALRVSGARTEVLVAARSMTSITLWTALRERAQAGVNVTTLLSPEGTTNFTAGKLAQWLRQNGLSSVYKDALLSASNVIVIDEKTVILSDLPFSQRSFDPTEKEISAGTVSLGFAYIIDSSELAKVVASTLRSRVNPSNKLL